MVLGGLEAIFAEEDDKASEGRDSTKEELTYSTRAGLVLLAAISSEDGNKCSEGGWFTGAEVTSTSE